MTRFRRACVLVLLFSTIAPSCVVKVGQSGSSEGGRIEAEEVPPGARYVGPGADAVTFLRAKTPKLVIEVDQARGSEVTDRALQHLQGTLEQVLDKPGGITLRKSTSFRPTDEDYTADDLRGLEERHRETSMNDNRASMYVLVLNGQFRDQRGVIGVAYSGSSFAIFLDEAARPGVGRRAAVERAVLVHEAGHLLALVNIGYESPRGREDPDHPNHSTNDGSVMHWAVETISILDLLGGGPPDSFDDADRADLKHIKQGKLNPTF